MKTGYSVPKQQAVEDINWNWLGQRFARDYAENLDWMILSKAKVNYIPNVTKLTAPGIVAATGIEGNRLIFLLNFCSAKLQSEEMCIDDLFSEFIEPRESLIGRRERERSGRGGYRKRAEQTATPVDLPPRRPRWGRQMHAQAHSHTDRRRRQFQREKERSHHAEAEEEEKRAEIARPQKEGPAAKGSCGASCVRSGDDDGLPGGHREGRSSTRDRRGD